MRADPHLFKDDVDIRFSRTLNSCKLPQIRYATPERLLQRLTDLRFLSIDFLNTFLLTYRVFTDGETVLNALKKVFYDPPMEPPCDCDHQTDFLELPYQDGCRSPRRTSGASSVSGTCHFDLKKIMFFSQHFRFSLIFFTLFISFACGLDLIFTFQILFSNSSPIMCVYVVMFCHKLNRRILFRRS